MPLFLSGGTFTILEIIIWGSFLLFQRVGYFYWVCLFHNKLMNQWHIPIINKLTVLYTQYSLRPVRHNNFKVLDIHDILELYCSTKQFFSIYITAYFHLVFVMWVLLCVGPYVCVYVCVFVCLCVCVCMCLQLWQKHRGCNTMGSFDAINFARLLSGGPFWLLAQLAWSGLLYSVALHPSVAKQQASPPYPGSPRSPPSLTLTLTGASHVSNSSQRASRVNVTLSGKHCVSCIRLITTDARHVLLTPCEAVTMVTEHTLDLTRDQWKDRVSRQSLPEIVKYLSSGSLENSTQSAKCLCIGQLGLAECFIRATSSLGTCVGAPCHITALNWGRGGDFASLLKERNAPAAWLAEFMQTDESGGSFIRLNHAVNELTPPRFRQTSPAPYPHSRRLPLTSIPLRAFNRLHN